MAKKFRVDLTYAELYAVRNSLRKILTCLCIALAIGLGVTQHKLLEAQEQNARMEQQLKEMGAQVNAILVEYIGQMKRIQQHGGQ